LLLTRHFVTVHNALHSAIIILQDSDNISWNCPAFLAGSPFRICRQYWSPTADMIHQNIVTLCQNGKSVSAELAKEPKLAPSEAAKKLFGHTHVDEVNLKNANYEKTDRDIEIARSCGQWGNSQPSDLFLQVCATSSLETRTKVIRSRCTTMFLSRSRRTLS
jgi:hypothetical protein